jgi:SAM-dependent methyltransferase
MARPDVSRTYENVDGSTDPADAAAWMDRVATYPAIAASKARSLQLLADCERVLDVGCGLGSEVRALGPGAVGVDPSRTMLAEAQARGGAFVRAHGQRLPFRRGAFDGARADRVLQHVAEPERVTAELVAAVRPGAPVVVTDPDQATLAIDGPDPALTSAVVAYRSRQGLRNGFLAGRMAAVLETAGCHEIGVERFTQVVEELPLAFGLDSWSGFMVEDGWFDEAQAATFDASLAAAAAAGTFAYRVDIVLTHGRRR